MQHTYPETFTEAYLNRLDVPAEAPLSWELDLPATEHEAMMAGLPQVNLAKALRTAEEVASTEAAPHRNVQEELIRAAVSLLCLSRSFLEHYPLTIEAQVRYLIRLAPALNTESANVFGIRFHSSEAEALADGIRQHPRWPSILRLNTSNTFALMAAARVGQIVEIQPTPRTPLGPDLAACTQARAVPPSSHWPLSAQMHPRYRLLVRPA